MIPAINFDVIGDLGSYGRESSREESVDLAIGDGFRSYLEIHCWKM